MKIKTVVLAVAFVAAASIGRAEPAPIDPWSDPASISAAAAELAVEIPIRVGAAHDAYAATRLRERIVVHDWGSWCLNGGLKSVNEKGEASLYYMELLPEALAGAARLMGRERLYEQAKALAGADSSETLADLERDLEEARRAQFRLAAREQALRAMLVGARWAYLGSDGLLHLSFEYDKDFTSVKACSGGGSD